MNMDKTAMTSVIFGVLMLVVGLVLSDIIIENVNKQGGKISCFNADDAPIKGARYDSTTGAAAGEVKMPREARHLKPEGGEAVGSSCGSKVGTASTTDVETVWSTSIGDQEGTIRYNLNVYGADGLNQLFTLVYWIVLIGISLSAIGGGGYKLARSNMG